VQRALRGMDAPVLCEEAEGAEAAIRAVAERAYDCVFLDYLLPDGDGLSVVKGIRALGIRTPIIILTGQGGERIAVDLMKAGASDYLLKGEATPERIQASLKSALRLHQAEQVAAEAERERTRFLELERAARHEAEAARQRLAFLAEASTVLTASLDPARTLETATKLLVPGLADASQIHLLEEGGAVRELATGPLATTAAAATDLRFPSLREAPAWVSRVVLEGVPDIEDGAPGGLGFSRVTVPLSAHGRTLGALTLLCEPQGRRYGGADLPFIVEVARRLSLALENARLYRDALETRERLYHQLDFTRAITNSLVEGLIALDLQGCVTFVNSAAERMLGWTAGDLAARRLHDAIHPPTGPAGLRPCRAGCALQEGFASGSDVRVGEDVLVRRDGTAFPVGYAAGPIVAAGVVVGSVIALNDLTARKAEEAELEASRRQVARTEKLTALGTLVSGVAHEIRTPLTYVNNNLFLMLRRVDSLGASNPDLAQRLHEIRACGAAALEGVDRIRNLVKDLRPFANTDPTKPIHITLHEVAAEAVEFFQATQRGRVEVDMALEATPGLHLDVQQVQRVILNLLINGSEAMPRGGTLQVTTRSVPGGAEIAIRDQGTGIPAEVQAHMFDPFFTTKKEGTGLGLAICRRIVEAHGGSIRYDTRMGEGTTFTVFFPLDSPPMRSPEAPAEAQAEPVALDARPTAG
ncbi:MAG TPA: ATP-binding protein, partial [Candidatus Thermoplasmatota archaeon]|nr:ATP-binding protein [Candidatus Thermoplasmatota archaeon]